MYPSKVEVPLPSSSRMTKESGVACCRIVAASVHSTRNVLSPAKILSWAPAPCTKLTLMLGKDLPADKACLQGQPCHKFSSCCETKRDASSVLPSPQPQLAILPAACGLWELMPSNLRIWLATHLAW